MVDTPNIDLIYFCVPAICKLLIDKKKKINVYIQIQSKKQHLYCPAHNYCALKHTSFFAKHQIW